ncbi:MAG: AMP-binding protein [Chloroflexi bacterium]|nr:AMP-binding protein [Chloroflexota bacterium]
MAVPSAWADRWTGASISTALARAVAQYGDREALVFRDARLTYRDLQRRADDVARGFLAVGIGPGDKVAIWMAGHAEWAYLYFGLLEIGAVLVPVNTRYKANELEYVLRKSEARALVFKDEALGDKDYAALLLEVCPELARAEPGKLASNHLPNLRLIVAVAKRPVQGAVDFHHVLRAGEAVSDDQLAAARQRVDGESIAMIQFTSGTTALPKGAQLFQVGMLRGADYGAQAAALSPTDRFFSPQPFYHSGGSIMVMLSPIVSGCTTFVQAYFDATEALRIMDEEQCNITMGHQPHWIEYLNHPDLPRRRIRLERAYIFASAEVNRMVAERLGISGLVGPYALTETHLGGTTCQLDDRLELRLATVGRPMPGLELQVRDPGTGQPVGAGERGEVCLRGWCVMKGYYKDPERTAEAVDANGWFRTGDLGVVDAQGYLRLIGRIKDMIRVGGENVAAADVEGFLLQHPAVKQVVAVGKPDLRLGEVVLAFVELKAGARATSEELIGYCRGGQASFKVPREIRFVDDWPMSGTGKIQRFQLKDAAAQ